MNEDDLDPAPRRKILVFYPIGRWPGARGGVRFGPRRQARQTGGSDRAQQELAAIGHGTHEHRALIKSSGEIKKYYCPRPLSILPQLDAGGRGGGSVGVRCAGEPP